MAKYYNIPHITSNDLEKEGKELKNDLGQEIQKKREEDIENERKRVEELPEKVQKTIDLSKFEPPIPDELLFKVLQQSLTSNVCRNRGYVLDDYPKNDKYAQYTFLSNFIIPIFTRTKEKRR